MEYDILLNAEWISNMKAFRLYNPLDPQQTVAYVDTLEEAQRPGYKIDDESAAKAKIEAFASAQDGLYYCPRCGYQTMNKRLHTNALSRYADVYICSRCGMNEALLDYFGTPFAFTDWAINKQ